MRRHVVGALWGIALAFLMAPPLPAQVSVTAVRHFSRGETTRVVVEATGDFKYTYARLSNPDRIYFDIIESRQKVSATNDYSFNIEDGLVDYVRVAQNRNNVVRVVLYLTGKLEVTSSRLVNPERLVLEVHGTGNQVERASTAEDAPPAAAPAAAPPSQAASEQASAAPSGDKVPLPDIVRPRRDYTATPPEAAELPPPPPATQQAETRAAEPPPPAETPRIPLEEKTPAPPPQPVQTAAATRPPPPPPAPPAVEPESEPEPEVAPEAEPAAADDQVEEKDNSLVPTPAQNNSSGSQSLTRALGLKLGRVVIDPGHGGRDVGTIGPSGIYEKDITLDVSKKLAKMIKERLHCEVIMTRDSDETVPLGERASMANDARADLFLSVHVNSSRYTSVNGIETFYLNFTESRESLEVAARENAGSNKSIHELSDLLQKIALDDKIQESRDFAAAVQSEVHAMTKSHDAKARDRGVKTAPFVVLIGAKMPAILVELGFITNPAEEKRLKTDSFRTELAEAIYSGVADYAATLSHFEVAAAGE